MFVIAPFANLGDLDEILQLGVSDWHSTFRDCYVILQPQFTPWKCYAWGQMSPLPPWLRHCLQDRIMFGSYSHISWSWNLEPNISGKNWNRHLNSDWFDTCNGSLFTGMKLALHKSQVHSYSIMSCCDELAVHTCPLLCLQRRVAKGASGLFYCWSSLRNNSNKSAKVHFILRQQAFCCMRLLNAHILGVNAARQWHADSGKPRAFILCENKHEWISSNASTSLKNPLLVGVWPMCLNVKPHLCRLLFVQYKITWLVRIHLCGLVGIRGVPRGAGRLGQSPPETYERNFIHHDYCTIRKIAFAISCHFAVSSFVTAIFF